MKKKYINKTNIKRIPALILALVMVLSLAACSGSGNSSNADNTDAPASSEKNSKTHIYVLTAAEDHGWTGSVATFAKEKVEELNAEGTYTAEVITAGNAAEQITKIEDIVASGEDNAAIVIQPMDDTVQSAIQQVIDAGIPYVAFDRIIDAVSGSAVSNVKGDNSGIGAGSAAYFVSLGMKPGDKVYVYEGDTSSVTTLRDNGFTDYLTGKLEFDGACIDDAAKWTEEELDSIVYSGAMNWSRSDTKESFESLMGDKSNADIKWIYAEDDELSMGVIEALAGGGIDDATKEAFLSNSPAITGCGGITEMYDVIRGNSYAEITERFSGICSVTYSPAMIQTAIQDMVDYLDGKQVVQDHVIPCENVIRDNVDNYPSF